jgi:hypothetical protein
MLAFNLVWEVLQIPLYTFPTIPFRYYKAYSIIHCTIGDGMIASVLFAVTGLAIGWRWPVTAPLRGLVLLLPLGVGYTAYSEWRNVYVLNAWTYDASMPTLWGIGLAPLAQWLVTPLLATWIVTRNCTRKKLA